LRNIEGKPKKQTIAQKQFYTSDKMMTQDAVEIDPINKERREKVKEAMLHAWNSYVTYAWGQDELQVSYIIIHLFLGICLSSFFFFLLRITKCKGTACIIHTEEQLFQWLWPF
jgi:hypothetical protein